MFAYILSYVRGWSNAENVWCICSNICNCNLKLSCPTNFSADQKDQTENNNKNKGSINLSQDFPFDFNWIILYSTCGDFIFILYDLFVIYWKKCKVLVLMVLITAAFFAHLFAEHCQQKPIISIKNIRITTSFYSLMSKVNCHEIHILYTTFVLNQHFTA